MHCVPFSIFRTCLVVVNKTGLEISKGVISLGILNKRNMKINRKSMQNKKTKQKWTLGSPELKKDRSEDGIG